MTTAGKRGQALAAAAVSLLLTGALPAAAASLQSHQARYQLNPTVLNLPGAVSANDGILVIRVEERCTDWLIYSKLQITMNMESGNDLTISSTSTLEEAKDSTSLVFDSEILFNGNTVQSHAGIARTPGEGKAGTVEFTESSDGVTTAALPEGTYFPVATYWRTLARIDAGEKVIDYMMFDGSGSQPTRATDVVAGAPKHRPDAAVVDTGLITGTGWRVITSFFDLEQMDAPPTSTNVFELYDSGVTGWVKYDIGLVEVDGVMTALERLPAPSC